MPIADEKYFPLLVSSSPRSYEHRRWRSSSPPPRLPTPRRGDPELRSADEAMSRPVSPTPPFGEYELVPIESEEPTQEEQEYEHIDLGDYTFPTRSASPNGTLVESETSHPASPAWPRRWSNSGMSSPLSGRKQSLSLSNLAFRLSDKENRCTRSRSCSRSKEDFDDTGLIKRSSSDSFDRPRPPLAAPKPIQAGGFLRHLSFSRPSSPLLQGDPSLSRDRRSSTSSSLVNEAA